MNENLKKIGGRIAEKRKEKKYTYRTMGNFLGVSPALYKKIEAGERSFSIEQLQTLCTVLHASPDWILTGQIGLLECTEIIENVQTTPEEFRSLSVKLSWIAKNSALKVKSEH